MVSGQRPGASVGRCLQLVAALSVAALSARPAWGTIYISGVVRDGATHGAIAGAAISLYAAGQPGPVAHFSTLRNGSYVLKAPEAGKYRITAQCAKYAFPVVRSVVVPRGGLPQQDILLQPGEPAVYLELFGPGEVPIRPQKISFDLSIGFGRSDFSGSGTAVVRPGGVVRVPVPAWELRNLKLQQDVGEVDRLDVVVRAASGGFGELKSSEWPVFPVKLQLKPGFTLAGAVLDARGRPVPEAAVELHPIQVSDDAVPVGDTELTAGKDGRFRVQLLPPANYYLLVHYPVLGERHLIVALFANRRHLVVRPDDPQ